MVVVEAEMVAEEAEMVVAGEAEEAAPEEEGVAAGVVEVEDADQV